MAIGGDHVTVKNEIKKMTRGAFSDYKKKIEREKRQVQLFLIDSEKKRREWQGISQT